MNPYPIGIGAYARPMPPPVGGGCGCGLGQTTDTEEAQRVILYSAVTLGVVALIVVPTFFIILWRESA